MLTHLTLTGADCSTDIARMFALSEQYPFIEWGILFHDQKVGTGRYPSIEWIHRLIWAQTEHVEQGHRPPRLALHLCGVSANQGWVDGKDYFSQNLTRLARAFQRVQMNVNASLGVFGANEIRQACQRHPRQQIITQHNQNNLTLWNLVNEKNHQILFDASGGRGEPLLEIQRPLLSRRCGYAGGFGPENIADVLTKLSTVQVTGNHYFWVDMESRLRVNEIFSLDLCEQVARQVTVLVTSQRWWPEVGCAKASQRALTSDLDRMNEAQLQSEEASDMRETIRRCRRLWGDL